MKNNIDDIRPQWRSETNYLLVTTGAVVGLGNFFQFPFLVAKFGGLFVLFYLLCEIAISIPLLFAELLIGRRGKQNPVGSIGILSIESNANYYWRLLGWLSFLISLLSWAYYSGAAAIPVNFFYSAVMVLINQGSGSLTAFDSNFTADFSSVEMCFLVFLIATMIVVIRGITHGLERISRIVVPTYFLILLALAIYMSLQTDFVRTLAGLVDMQTTEGIMTILFAALSFAFFKLGVGMGTMIVYGSYLPYSVSFGRSTLLIVCFDAIISLLAYLIIYPLMLTANVPTFGSGLVNRDLVSLFTSTPNGLYIAAFFFLAAIIAAWTPTIAMAETVVVTIVERFNVRRFIAVLYISLAILLIGGFAILTNTRWEHVVLFNTFALKAITFKVTSKLLTFIAAFFVAIFAGWVLPRHITFSELGFKSFIYAIWLFLVRFVAPISIVLIGIATVL